MTKKDDILNKLIPKLDDNNLKILLDDLIKNNKHSDFFVMTNNFKGTNKYNIICDSYFNDLILQARYYSSDESPWQFLNNPNNKDIINKVEVDNFISSLKRGTNQFTKKVANFPTINAKTIYDSYLNEIRENIILDISAGWGSRILGAWASNKVNQYYFFEPNIKLFYRLIEFGKKLNNYKQRLDFKGYAFSSHVFIKKIVKKVDLIFSSPPYFNREIYSDDISQSINLFPKFDDWLEKYWKKTLLNCYKYLKKNGTMIINIKNIDNPSYKLADLTIALARDIGFILYEIIDMKIGSNKKEPLLIFKKVENGTLY